MGLYLVTLTYHKRVAQVC